MPLRKHCEFNAESRYAVEASVEVSMPLRKHGEPEERWRELTRREVGVSKPLREHCEPLPLRPLAAVGDVGVSKPLREHCETGIASPSSGIRSLSEYQSPSASTARPPPRCSGVRGRMSEYQSPSASTARAMSKPKRARVSKVGVSKPLREHCEGAFLTPSIPRSSRSLCERLLFSVRDRVPTRLSNAVQLSGAQRPRAPRLRTLPSSLSRSPGDSALHCSPGRNALRTSSTCASVPCGPTPRWTRRSGASLSCSRAGPLWVFPPWIP